ncbi:SymE family type I addiction module toxin [Pantoea sp. MBD-2R]|uniref:SymE family type I addiction module toxin n=1 Tax=Pantoea sp. MBD-2R TaxID=3141540 RepID=UPI00318428D2
MTRITVPAVTLKGHWLVEAGFDTGTALEPQPEPPAEPEVVTMLRKACKKLSARKQQQVTEFIQVIATPQKRLRKIPEGMVEWCRLD